MREWTRFTWNRRSEIVGGGEGGGGGSGTPSEEISSACGRSVMSAVSRLELTTRTHRCGTAPCDRRSGGWDAVRGRKWGLRMSMRSLAPNLGMFPSSARKTERVGGFRIGCRKAKKRRGDRGQGAQIRKILLVTSHDTFSVVLSFLRYSSFNVCNVCRPIR